MTDAHGWRPIAEAPRDGTRVVVYTTGGHALVASWQFACCIGSDGTEADAWMAQGIHPRCWTDGICWERNEDDEPSDAPTHWQPLPAPPEDHA